MIYQNQKKLMKKPVDRDQKYMKDQWGTVCLITDIQSERFLNQNQTYKRHNFSIQKKIHENIRNDEDYDDWEYGNEPTFGI